MNARNKVVVVIGTGGMGLAALRRVGVGASVVIADFDEARLETVTADTRVNGYDVTPHRVDVADSASVKALAANAAALGPVTAVIHTAGLSPVQAPTSAVLSVDLLGTAHVIDAFGDVIAAGGAGVVIASMAGQTAQVSPELEAKLRSTPTDELLAIDELTVDGLDALTAYGYAKRGNQLRVQAGSRQWGLRGARINSISPGVISTAMGHQELEGASGDMMKHLIAGSGTGRIGTADDIAAAIAFLTGPESSFITGTDLLVDGGVIASLMSPSS